MIFFFFLSARSRVRQNYHISTAMEYRGASSQQPQQRRHEQQQAICTQSGWLQTPDLLSLTRHSARFLGWGFVPAVFRVEVFGFAVWYVGSELAVTDVGSM